MIGSGMMQRALARGIFHVEIQTLFRKIVQDAGGQLLIDTLSVDTHDVNQVLFLFIKISQHFTVRILREQGVNQLELLLDHGILQSTHVVIFVIQEHISNALPSSVDGNSEERISTVFQTHIRTISRIVVVIGELFVAFHIGSSTIAVIVVVAIGVVTKSGSATLATEHSKSVSGSSTCFLMFLGVDLFVRFPFFLGTEVQTTVNRGLVLDQHKGVVTVTTHESNAQRSITVIISEISSSTLINQMHCGTCCTSLGGVMQRGFAPTILDVQFDALDSTQA
mmetsp:Transcript_60176/g.68532  ORF Transcript_60176/g.68532 Transcript_60176/m.68532 type:complete len:280 (-) Transcript_60176:94-933(-)